MAGKIVTVLIRLAIAAYVVWNIIKIVKGEGGIFVPGVELLDLKTAPAIKFKESKLLVFHVISKESADDALTSDELQRHLNITFEETSTSKKKAVKDPASKSTPDVTRKRFLHRKCQESDFSDNNETLALFKTFEGKYLVCPDYQSGEMQGNDQATVHKVLDIDFKICNFTNVTNNCAL